MNRFLKMVIGDKREWSDMQSRAKTLPRDYQIVYGEIMQYMWIAAGNDGTNAISILKGLLDLFETGAADGKHALEVTGKDVGAFCDELLRDTEDRREALNRNVLRKLSRGETDK